jgi:glyceraldehyde-3-phosphate dehydrogenase (NADP+)
MDLGGNARVIVMGDFDLEAAVESCLSGAFWAAGQNCIGTQRLLIQASIYEAFRERFVSQAKALVNGDPMRADTDIGPMITPQAVQNAEQVVNDALQEGATLLCGDRRQGSSYAATVLENVDHCSRLWRTEVFAPVVVLQLFDTFDEAIALANEPEYSLHAGIFTNDLATAMSAARGIEAGGMINDSSDYRFDAVWRLQVRQPGSGRGVLRL